MSRLFLLIFSCFLTQAVQGECIFLDLDTAWERILSQAPSIAAVDAEIRARIGDRKQVSVIPNPLFAVEADTLGFCDRYCENESDPSETTFSLTQLIELGGKRKARRALASTVVDLAYWDSQIVRSDLRLACITAFIDVSVAQEKWKLAQEREEVAAKMLQAIETKVDGGKISPILAKKTHIIWMTACIATREALSEFVQTKKSLSSLWGCALPDFDCVTFSLFDCLEPPPCYDIALQGLSQMPDVARAQASIDSAAKNVRLQMANSIPDVTVTVGYTVCNDCPGWLVGAAIPLPFFDRNQGNIQRAHAERDQANYAMDDVMRDLGGQLLIAHEKLVAAFEESELIRNGILAEAQDTFNLIQIGYQNGKLEYIDVLDAQNALFEIQEKYIEILHGYYLSRAELERLTGQQL